MNISDGDVVIVTCNDNLKQPVLVNRIKVSLVGCSRDKAEIKATASQSLFLPYLAGELKEIVSCYV